MMEALLLLFLIFPFTKILPLESYNQPYAFLTALAIMLLMPKAYLRMPQIDRIMLAYMGALGIVMFCLAAPGGLTNRLFQYLLAYVTPVIIVPAAVFVIRRNPDRARKFLTWGIVVWVGVGVAQLLVTPNFLVFLASHAENLATNIIESGRGRLGLAPEPTHHALHMLALGASLSFLRGPTWAVGLTVVSALFIALSSFSVLILLFGLIIWVSARPWRWPALFAGAFGTSVFINFGAMLFQSDSRVGTLLGTLSENGLEVLLLDASSNARFYGIVSPIAEVFRRGFIPLGMDSKAWAAMSDAILYANPKIIFLSQTGPASGYGLVLVQAGIFALPLLFYFLYRIFWIDSGTWRGIAAATGFSVFLGQIYLTTPSFSLMLASAIVLLQDKEWSKAKISKNQAD